MYAVLFSQTITMCGIWALFGITCPEQRMASFERIKHRGPDAWRMEYDDAIKVFPSAFIFYYPGFLQQLATEGKLRNMTLFPFNQLFIK